MALIPLFFRPFRGLSCLLFSVLACASAVALEIEGSWEQGRLLKGQVEPGSKVRFQNRNVRVGDDGLFVIGLGRDAPKEVVLQVVDPSGETNSHKFEVKQRQYRIQRVEGVPAETVNPPPEQLARIQADSALTREARALDLERRDFLQAFEWPVIGPISGVYGSQRYYNGEPRRPHFGVDVAMPTGTPVKAPAAGIVTMAHDDMFFSGGTMILDHGNGVSSSFLHLSKILVKKGQKVKQGEMIAEVGATGRATGAHLDWRMNWFSHPIDPTFLVGPMPEQ
jgi:murein DD-endopeptidase MepM/ murein hydrolase activator NlpD